jgi:hypothetical protein
MGNLLKVEGVVLLEIMRKVCGVFMVTDNRL